MIILFDTNGGLCNQFYDICNGIHFCLQHNLQFTFRYCAFRDDTLMNWFQAPFEKLFDTSFLNQYPLYIRYHDLKDKVTKENCYNFNSRLLAHLVLNEENIVDQLIQLDKEYVVLCQFWSLYKFKNITDYSIYSHLFPSNDIMKKYRNIKNNIIGEPYNYIHYRYEKDFTTYFNVTVESLDCLLEKIPFKNNQLKIFIATSNLQNVIDLHQSKYKHLLYKNEEMLSDLNFEQRAFIDYMFGLNSVECFGHRKSSFSVMINHIKQTNNYYA